MSRASITFTTDGRDFCLTGKDFPYMGMKLATQLAVTLSTSIAERPKQSHPTECYVDRTHPTVARLSAKNRMARWPFILFRGPESEPFPTFIQRSIPFNGRTTDCSSTATTWGNFRVGYIRWISRPAK